MADLDKIKNPHDRFFKVNMQNLRVARSFFEAHLPVKLIKSVDFDTLKLESGTFIDKKLKELLSDLIYSVMIAGKQSYLYLITEHQSSIPDLMPFRILQYDCGIMENHLKQLPESAPKLLPLVINIVFYHGEVTPYVQSCDLFDYFAESELAREFMFKPFTLIDVNQIPDEELAKHHWAALFELIQKHTYERDMLPFLEKLFKGEFNIEISSDSDLLYIMVKYIVETGGVNNKNKEKFVELLTHALPEGEKKMPTLAEMWLEEGYQKGIHAGIERGIEKGKYEEAIEIARNMLAKGIDPKLVQEVTHLSHDEVMRLIQNH